MLLSTVLQIQYKSPINVAKYIILLTSYFKPTPYLAQYGPNGVFLVGLHLTLVVRTGNAIRHPWLDARGEARKKCHWCHSSKYSGFMTLFLSNWFILSRISKKIIGVIWHQCLHGSSAPARCSRSFHQSSVSRWMTVLVYARVYGPDCRLWNSVQQPAVSEIMTRLPFLV
jgi:hypothetical protein